MTAPLVLVGEDDDELRWLLIDKLRRHGCDVIEARTGPQLAALVLERVGSEVSPPDVARAALLISDVRMPGCSGLAVVALLRRLDAHTPAILMTAFGDARIHSEARLLGVTAMFDKPVDLDDLAAAAHAAITYGGPAGRS